jgi:signal peptidase
MPRHAVGIGAYSSRRYLPLVGNAFLWVLVIVGGILLWPTTLGGQTALIIVTGRSMEPTYYDGDLVVARTETPKIGDVVVYRPKGYQGAQVVHRIVGGTPDSWVIQGDNNSWVDPFDVTSHDIVGVVKLHIPNVGVIGKVLISPITWAFILLAAVALVIWPDSGKGDDDDEDAGDLERSAPAVGATR